MPRTTEISSYKMEMEKDEGMLQGALDCLLNSLNSLLVTIVADKESPSGNAADAPSTRL